MVLYVKFSDCSNPWVSLPCDRDEIKKRWKQWKRSHPETVELSARCGDWSCEEAGDGSGYWVWKRGDYFKTCRFYKRLGCALRMLAFKGRGFA